MENLVLMSFAVYSISPSDQAKNIAVSLSRHFPTPYFIGSHFHIESGLEAE